MKRKTILILVGLAVALVFVMAPVRVYANSPWNGQWETDWGGMSIIVKADRTVDIIYTHKNGRIKGTLSPDGRRITGRWSQEPDYKPNQNAGSVVFQLSSTNRSFSGSWWYGFDTSAPANGTWTGVKR